VVPEYEDPAVREMIFGDTVSFIGCGQTAWKFCVSFMVLDNCLQPSKKMSNYPTSGARRLQWFIWSGVLGSFRRR
jgi:hypothetical protein